MLTNEEIAKMAEGRTGLTEFLATVGANADRVALRSKNDDGSWTNYTFAELAEKVAKVAGGLKGLGVGKGDRVLLMMRNIPDFHWFDVGTGFTGATPVSIYNSSAPDQVEYLAQHSSAKVAIVEDESWTLEVTQTDGNRIVEVRVQPTPDGDGRVAPPDATKKDDSRL